MGFNVKVFNVFKFAVRFFYVQKCMRVQKQCGVIDTAESGSAVSMTSQRQKKNFSNFSFIFHYNIEKIS